MPIGFHIRHSDKSAESGRNAVPPKPVENKTSNPTVNKTKQLDPHAMLVNKGIEACKSNIYHRAEKAKCEQEVAKNDADIAELDAKQAASEARMAKARAILAKREAERAAASKNPPPQIKV